MKAAIIFLLVLPLLFILSGTCHSSVDHSGYSSVRQCLGCHPMAYPTHSMKRPQHAPSNLPLNASGRIVCITCHDCVAGTCRLRETSPELCRECHDCKQGMACVLGTAHIGESQDILHLSLDNCLGCHDGSVAKEVSTHGHPVNALYLSHRRGLNRITDKKIVLVEGKITCLSCHNPYGTNKGKLVKSNEGSRLCLSCHRK